MKELLFILSFVFYLNTNAQIITTVAGNGTHQTGNLGNGGSATLAEVWDPEDVFVDKTGNIYIIDYGNGQIRKVNTAGIISMYAGGGTNNCPVNVPATQVRVGECFALTCDTLNNLYISDINSQIVKVNTGDSMHVVAGSCTATGTFGGDGGQATAAELYWPGGIAIDKYGNMFISDSYNHRIRKVSSNGIINTIAGTGTQGYAGDGGQATAAQFNYPNGITVDNIGNVYIADRNNNRIRMINTSGIISTIAGIGVAGFTGDGGQATGASLNNPYDVEIDVNGDLYIADAQNQRIRKINSSGIIKTIAGNGINGFSGDGGQATAAALSSPLGIAFDTFGNLYIADEGNNRVRKVTNIVTTAIAQYSDFSPQIFVYPNPSNGVFNLSINNFDNDKIYNLNIYNITGECMHEQIATSSNCQIDLSNLPAGVYNINLSGSEGFVNKRIVIAR